MILRSGFQLVLPWSQPLKDHNIRTWQKDKKESFCEGEAIMYQV